MSDARTIPLDIKHVDPRDETRRQAITGVYKTFQGESKDQKERNFMSQGKRKGLE